MTDQVTTQWRQLTRPPNGADRGLLEQTVCLKKNYIKRVNYVS